MQTTTNLFSEFIARFFDQFLQYAHFRDNYISKEKHQIIYETFCELPIRATINNFPYFV